MSVRVRPVSLIGKDRKRHKRYQVIWTPVGSSSSVAGTYDSKVTADREAAKLRDKDRRLAAARKRK